MSDIPNILPWAGKQSCNNRIPWYFPSQDYNNNFLNDVKYALQNNIPLSWIRCGDGEICVLQHGYKFPTDQCHIFVPWSGSIGYCGTKLPNIPLRDRLIEAYKDSDYVGVFKGDPPTEEIFKILDIQPKNLTYAFLNIGLPMNKDFVNMLIKYPLLIVGKNSNTYKYHLEDKLNANVVGTVSIESYDDIDRCMNEMLQYDYKLALVSAGVNAKIICSEMKKRKTAVYLDMGHYMDNVLAPNYIEYWLIPKWQLNKTYQPTEQVIHETILYKCISTIPLQCNIAPDIDKENWILW